MTTKTLTALVTGSNSGLGFEAAAQLAEAGWGRVILATRTLAKAETARQQLVERTGRDPFEPLVVDVGDNAVVTDAVSALGDRGGRIDLLLLNAGLVSGDEIVRNGAGIERTVAASLIGHHVLTMGLLDAGLLADTARVVIAGSEAARGDVPMMGISDVPAFAAEHAGGDRVQAIATIARAEAPYAYKPMPHYANTKVLVAWWAAALGRRLPSGMGVFAVSPGSAPATGAARHQGWFMRSVMSPILGSWLGRSLGMGATTGDAARRYLDAFDYGPERSGGFFASRPGKMVGAVVRQEQPHVLDEASQEAAWQAVVALSGADLPRRTLTAVS